MKLITLLLTAAALLAVGTALSPFQQGDRYYYAYNERILLSTVENKLIVRYANEANRPNTESFIRQISSDASTEWLDNRTAKITVKSGVESQALAGQLSKRNDVYTVNPVYTVKTGLEMGVTDEILLHFRNQTAQKQQEDLHRRFNTEVLKTTPIYQLVRVSKGVDALEIANQYQESGLVEYAHPNFLVRAEKFQVIPNDEFFGRQFSFHNTGQLINDGRTGTPDADIDGPEAWITTRGCNNITVAVLDEGVTADHPDLPNARQARLNGSNFAAALDGTNANDPAPVGDGNHGNACAGMVAATQGNGQGISGIAPNVRIMPVRIPIGVAGSTPQNLADAITFAVNNGADVLSNSWGYDIDNPNAFPVIVTAIQNATTNGRGGRGCVVAFAAGNFARHNQGIDHFAAFPSNVNVAGVLTVGASDRNDFQADYSPSDDDIDIAAPSHRAFPLQVGGIAGETFEVWSMDMSNNPGYNPWKDNAIVVPPVGEQLPAAGINFLSYTGRFGGTSAACPQVAGVAALMLSINPNLTQQQIFNALTGTADQVGGYAYNNGRSRQLGFGRLNACRAVANALGTLSLTVTGPGHVCPSGNFSVNAPACVESVTWTASSNISLNTTTGTTVTATNTSTGSGWVEVALNSGCNGTVRVRRNVYVGAPEVIQMRLDGSPIQPYSPRNVCVYGYFNLNADLSGLGSSSWQIINNSSGASITNSTTNTATVYTGNTTGSFVVRLTLSNGCGTTERWYVFNVNNCGYFSYSVQPNPAKDKLSVVFEPGTDGKLFPEKYELIEERSMKTAAVVEFESELAATTALRDARKVNIDVSNLPRGQYTLRITRRHDKEKPLDALHVLLE